MSNDNPFKNIDNMPEGINILAEPKRYQEHTTTVNEEAIAISNAAGAAIGRVAWRKQEEQALRLEVLKQVVMVAPIEPTEVIPLADALLAWVLGEPLGATVTPGQAVSGAPGEAQGTSGPGATA